VLATIIQQEKQSRELHNLRVLIAEDNAGIARLFALLLRKHGCQVEECHSGLSAITIAPLFSPDVLLLDIGLPGLDGYEVAQYLIQEMGEMRPYIIAITAYTQERYRQRAQDVGIDHFLTKPVTSHELIDHLVEWLDD
jgi:CheY-like chemotaxis protein